jgi:hypothetical protein
MMNRDRGNSVARRAQRIIAEALENRTLFSGVSPLVIDPPYIGTPADSAAQSSPPADGVAAAGLTVPVYNSLPGATHRIYLDFNGDNTPSWGDPNFSTDFFHPGVTPAYDSDGDPTSFSATELANIRNIWARVAEKYSPFNINVTTVDPGVYAVGVTTHVVIGGLGAWLGASAGGVAQIFGFSGADPNLIAGTTCFIFSAEGPTAINFVGEAAAHESGHTFGLLHHSQYVNGVYTQEYDPGSAQVAPIMGVSYNTVRGLWYDALDDTQPTPLIQDDLALITSDTNGFGYRADDVGDTLPTATQLLPSGQSISFDGVITSASDKDFFSFAAPQGTLQLHVASPNAGNGGMIDASLDLEDANGNVLSSQNTASLSESISYSLPSAGTYYVVVKSHGNYGDIGQYSLTGTLPVSVFQAVPGGPYSATEYSATPVQLSGSSTGGSAVSYAWDFNYNGSTFNPTSTAQNPTFSVAAIDGPATQTIALRVVDAIGDISTVTTTLSIADVAPTAVLSNNGPIAAVQTGTVSFSGASDISPVDLAAGFTYSYDFNNDGTFDITGTAASSATVPGSITTITGSHVIRARIIDKDGGFTDYLTTLVVTPKPVAVLGNSGPVAEGATGATVTFSSVLGSAPFTYSYDLNNDGIFEISGTTATLETIPASMLTDGPRTLPINARVTDINGAFSDFTTTLTVTNLAPAAAITGAPQTIVDEGSSVTLSAGAIDVPADTAAGFSFNWTVTRNSVTVATATGSTFVLSVRDSGSYSVSLTATDKDAGVSVPAVATFTSANLPPTATFSGASPVIQGNTGQVSFTGASDPSPADTAAGFTYSYDFNNDGTFEIINSTAASATVPANFLSTPGINLITGRIKDKDGGFTDYTASIDVRTTPKAVFSNDTPVTEGAASATISFTSIIDGAAPYTFSYDFDNNNTFEIAGSAATSEPVPVQLLSDGPAHPIIHGRITDSTGLFTDYTTTLTVNNAAPVVSMTGAPQTMIDEGSSVNFSASASDVPADIAAGFSFQWTAKRNGTSVKTAAGASFTLNVADDGSYSVSVTATDKDHATSAPLTALFTARNVAPTATLSSGGAVIENNPGSVSFSSPHDVSSADTAAGFTYSYDFNNDGVFDITGSTAASVTVPAIYLDGSSATQTVLARISDKDGGFTDYTTAIPVRRHAHANFTPSSSVAEGATGTISFLSATGPGPYTYSYDFDDDGVFDIANSTASSATVPATYFADGPFTRSVAGRITSSDGLTTDYVGSIQVTNTPPAISIGGTSARFQEVSPVNLAISATDVPADTAAGFVLGWTISRNSAVLAGGSSAAIAFTPNDSGIYLLNVTATDKDGGVSSTTRLINVNDVVPTAVFAADSVPEGSAGRVTFTHQTDVSPIDLAAGFTYSYDFNNDGVFEISNTTDSAAAIPASLLADGPATHTLRARITDKDGGFTEYTAPLIVTNVAPTIQVTGSASGAVAEPYSLALSATDPGRDTISTWTIDWGDGTLDHLGAAQSPPPHGFRVPGTYLIYVSATDEDGTFPASPLTVAVAPAPPVPVDSVAPVASASSFAPPASGASSYSFTVNYSDDESLNLASVQGDEIQVRSPSGAALPVTFMGITASSPTSATASYQFLAPGGVFNAPSSGAYSFAVLPGSVTDAAGNGIDFTPIGSFTKTVPAAAADLTTQLITKTPSQIQPGYKGSATLRIMNRGDKAMIGPITLTLSLSTDTTPGNDDLRLVHTDSAVSLAPGQSKDFTVNFTIPASTPAGKYFLMGAVKPLTATAELSDLNNTAVSPLISISRPFADLRPAKLSIKSGARLGGKLGASLQLSNLGTLAVNGAVTFSATLVASPGTTSGTSLAPIAQSLQLKPGGSKTDALNFSLPANLSPGTYYLLLTVSPASSLGDTNLSDKTIFSANRITIPN